MTTCYHPERRFAYVHIPKCAGTSIGGLVNTKTKVWSECWLNEVLPGWTRHGMPNGHQPVRNLQQFTGQSLEFWDKIIVTVRNPFEQQLSQYHFWRERGLLKSSQGKGYHDDDRFACSMDFESFVQDPRSNGPNAMCGEHWREVGGVYRWWCTDAHGVIPPNVVVIRVEDMQEELPQVLGLEKWEPIPQTNSVDKPDWQAAYSETAARAVRHKFAWGLATKYPELAQFNGGKVDEPAEAGVV